MLLSYWVAHNLSNPVLPDDDDASNPYIPGVFYVGEFISGEFIPTFTEIFADERLAVFVRIAARPDVSVLAMRHSYVAFELDNIGASYGFLYVDSDGQLSATFDVTWFSSKTINIISTSLPPTVLVMTDENGGLRYLRMNPSTLAMTSTGTDPGLRPDFYQYYGPYIEFVGEDGESVYRLTVNSSNELSVDLNRVEERRNQDLYVSHGHHRPYAMGHLWIGHLASLGDMETHIEQTETSFGGVSVPNVGTITITLADAFFDYVVNQSWDGRDVEILAGLTTQPISEYRVILRSKTQSAEWDLDTLRITMMDQGLLFDRSVQINTYDGTGGYEGTAEVRGQLKPLMYGFVAHVRPILLDPNTNLYQFHDGVSDVSKGIEVRQGGIVMGNWIQDNSLLTWTPTQEDVDNGRLRVDFSRGLFRLAAPPGGVITVTKDGDTSVSVAATLSEIVRALIRRVIPEAQIDANSFDAHRASLAQRYGIYLTENATLKQVLNDLTAPTSDFVALTRLNSVVLRHLNRTPAKAFLTDKVLLEGSVPQRRSAPRPGSQYRLAYEKTWYVFDESQLLGALTDERIRQLLQSKYRWNEFTLSGQNHPGRDRYDSSKIVDLETEMIQRQNDLLVEIALRDFAHKDLYTIIVVGYSFLFEIGDTVLVQFNRWGITTPKTMLIVGITEMSPTLDREDQTQLVLWG